ncbi:hypothetical protein [Jannaschia aquimarina]|uniref:Uncharacterized protein n=1 Tax=Jannaschia aquimarina TaxID=935700 RepID=A0A0D1EI57_9RHOB|nr:hypothetical protein [Jannaschia aquimarina]KIT16586.1 hypothetical protein jaqu_16810 [Jannaschia aquimarina]SNT41482.1 hypothetical protein SAMN05421775_11712 [Jannaschia aquimarina]
MARYNLTIPVTYTQNGQEKTRYQRVGTIFENVRDNGDTLLSVKLDFPVGVTELVGFLPKPKDEDDHPIEE